MIFLLWEIGAFLVNILLAFWHYCLIKHNRSIKHALWEAGYIVFVGVAFYFTRNWLLVIAMFSIRELVFAQALNLFRKLDFWYANPNGTSKWDAFIGKYYKTVYFLSLGLLLYVNIRTFLH